MISAYMRNIQLRTNPRTKALDVQTSQKRTRIHGQLYDGKKYHKLDTSDRDDSHLSIRMSRTAGSRRYNITSSARSCPRRIQKYHFTPDC